MSELQFSELFNSPWVQDEDGGATLGDFARITPLDNGFKLSIESGGVTLLGISNIPNKPYAESLGALAAVFWVLLSELGLVGMEGGEAIGDEDKEWLSVDEAATILSVNPATIRNLARNGKLEARKIGRIWRVPKSAVQKLTA